MGYYQFRISFVQLLLGMGSRNNSGEQFIHWIFCLNILYHQRTSSFRIYIPFLSHQPNACNFQVAYAKASHVSDHLQGRMHIEIVLYVCLLYYICNMVATMYESTFRAAHLFIIFVFGTRKGEW